MKIRAILFDMDGVLVDAKEWHYEALNQALALFGMEINRYDHLVTYDGLPTKKKLEMLSMERGLSKRLHGFINEMKQKFTLDYIHTKCAPLFCHEYALSRLKKEGYYIGVCSNSMRQTVSLIMAQSKLEPYLDLSLSNEDVIQGKPDPEIYIKAMAHLGVSPQECFIVEDNEKGIKAAKGSGAHVMVVSDVQEVNYFNIISKIKEIEAKS